MTAYTSPLLGDDEIGALTGLDQPAAQRRWLDRHGIRYLVRADGRPRTTWGAVEAAMRVAAEDAPDFSAIG